jgi:hypothetical protein
LMIFKKVEKIVFWIKFLLLEKSIFNSKNIENINIFGVIICLSWLNFPKNHYFSVSYFN